jgi:hypothetical protein
MLPITGLKASNHLLTYHFTLPLDFVFYKCPSAQRELLRRFNGAESILSDTLLSRLTSRNSVRRSTKRQLPFLEEIFRSGWLEGANLSNLNLHDCSSARSLLSGEVPMPAPVVYPTFTAVSSGLIKLSSVPTILPSQGKTLPAPLLIPHSFPTASAPTGACP